MYDATQLSISTQVNKIFNGFLFFYPKSYRKHFGKEMRLIFAEMYQEELAKNGKVGTGFWFSQFGDITKSVIEQHIDEIGKKGMKKYLKNTLHLSIFNVISFILLLPFVSLLCIDFVSRLLHYNRQAAVLLQHSFFYSLPVLFTGIVIFPILAILFSIFPLFKSLSKKHTSLFSWRFVFSNFITFAFVGLGFFALLVVFGHDVIPCTIHGLSNKGIFQFRHIISVCRKA